jgi:hypothetical protein
MIVFPVMTAVETDTIFLLTGFLTYTLPEIQEDSGAPGLSPVPSFENRFVITEFQMNLEFFVAAESEHLHGANQ